MVMVDQRNHGASAGLPLHPPHSIDAAAGDLTRLVQTELGGRMPKAVLGHSLGGKIVLEFLQQSSQEGRELPEQVNLLQSICMCSHLKQQQPDFFVPLHNYQGPEK